MFARHLEAISQQVAELAKWLHELDDRLDRRIDETQQRLRDQLLAHIKTVESELDHAKESIRLQVDSVMRVNEERSRTWDAKLSFPTRVVWIIVLGSLSTATVMSVAQFCNHKESQRSFTLPTTPPPPGGMVP